MKSLIPDWLPKLFVKSEGSVREATTKKFSQFNYISDTEGMEVVGIKNGANVRADFPVDAGEVTTSMVGLEPDDALRNTRGQFMSTKYMPVLENQKDANRFIASEIQRLGEEIEGLDVGAGGGDVDLSDYATIEYVDETELNVLNAAIKVSQDGDKVLQDQIDALEVPDIDGLATQAQLGEVDRTAIMRDDALKKEHDEDSAKQSVINAGVVVSLDELFWRDVEMDQASRDGDNALQEQITESKNASESGDNALQDQITENKDSSESGDRQLQDQIDENKDASESGDRQLQAEVEEIALALETLLVQREHGKWKYIGFSGDNIPRNPGEFSLLSDDLSASENNITINQTDLGGTLHGFGDTSVGDFLEVVDLDNPDEYALFVVDSEPDGTGIVSMNLKLKDKGNNFLVGTTCEIRFFQLNEQDLNLTDLDSRYVKKTGDTMTGRLEATDLRVKDLTPGTVAPILVEGWVNGTNEAARITMSNKQYNNAYGNLTWHGNNGNGWFQFNKDVDLSSKNLHSVNHIRLTGDRIIQENQADRIKLDGKVTIPKAGSSNTAGFTIKGTTGSGNNGDLLRAYHNSSGLDAINYEGRTTAGSTNLATCEYVDNKVSGGSAGSLVSHTERLFSTANGSDGNMFYFQNENGVPTTGMNGFRKFKWKLPDWHYLSKMDGAGNNIGFLVVCNTSGSLLYQCPVSKADKSGLHITLELDHDHHYGSGAIGNQSFFVVHMYSCLREGSG